MIDFVVLLSLMMLGGGFFGFVMLLTPYKRVANNKLVHLIQKRYVSTSCSLGCILQQLYQSGPSGHVTLVADYLFHGNGFSSPRVEFSFPIRKAMAMGLLRGEKSTGTKVCASSKYASSDATTSHSMQSGAARHESSEDEISEMVHTDKKSLFDKNLCLFSETTYGRVILVDQDKPGSCSSCSATDMNTSTTGQNMRLKAGMFISPSRGRFHVANG
ncbi:hypothetical protein PF001_g3309 [Phytophthora fragariae]|uniref:Uncharacterized protein n=1 Tax=Phytophthora fragariae TaxID=53985 RepID=A0A6A3UK69_9STRA|nr:hypothetical protein PF009_g4633 [Phytophthora fragariae]KAE9150567.1 hypothetical protein PF006_g5064 [Phytophthora fragariae]KAE9324670.1 hypothetical protein PF001_g3309 [Phytophthora fragariae]